jgi:hypothetical protein
MVWGMQDCVTAWSLREKIIIVCYSSWAHASFGVRKGPPLSGLDPIRREPETE